MTDSAFAASAARGPSVGAVREPPLQTICLGFGPLFKQPHPDSHGRQSDED